MNLNILLNNVDVTNSVGSIKKIINKIQFDSRKVEKNDLFIALKGTEVNGHDYIEKSIQYGAAVVVCEKLPELLSSSVQYIVTKDNKITLAILASNFYHSPSSKIKLVGITGTNGKTSIASLLYQLFSNLNYKVGLISTIENRILKVIHKSSHTTPDPLQINFLLSEMVKQKCTHCFMEVSSHAISQERTFLLDFDGAVFTNITHDHLDYHKTFLNYINIKQKFFTNLKKNAFSIINKDDKNGEIMVQNSKSRKITYALSNNANYKVKILESHFEGMMLDFNGVNVWVKLIGKFNAYNLLAAYATADLLGLPSNKIVEGISLLSPAEGRFEVFRSSKDVFVVLDYAHTEDALLNVLMTIKKISNKSRSIITVFGCGGDRDKSKRPKMTLQASKLSSQVIITEDNPRGENQNEIVSDMTNGLDSLLKDKVLVINDRKSAIKTAFALAQKNDVILIAGKGHEKYQEKNGVKKMFDDKEEIFKHIIN